MASAPDFHQLGADVVDALGGEENISSLTHCATRLRFVVKDPERADLERARSLDGVITGIRSGGQHQIVIGNDVVQAYEAILADTQISQPVEDGASAAEDGTRRTAFTRFVSMISDVFSPVIWTMAAVGLVKAFLALFTTGIPLLSTDSQEYAVLNALGDGFMLLLPVMLAVSAAKHFAVNYATTMAVAGFLVYPTVQDWFTQGSSVHFFGIPVVLAAYTYSVFPIIVAAWLQSLLEPRVARALPSWMRNFTTPFVVLVVIGLLTLLVIGPIISGLTNLVAAALTWVWGPAPWLGGLLMGGLWQIFVMFGLHWGIVPIMLSEIADHGYSLLFGPLPSAVVAQCAAALAVALRTQDKKLSQMALPTALAGFFSGVTEPLVYGVNLPLKKPFAIAIGSGAVGGALAAAGGSASNANVFSSLLTLPAFLDHGSFLLQVLGVCTAMLLGFFGTYFFGMPRKAAAATTPVEPATGLDLDAEAAVPAQRVPSGKKVVDASAQVVPAGVVVPVAVDAEHTTDLVAASTGHTLPLSSLEDPVFSSGAMGQGIAIEPALGQAVAPIAGKVVTAMDTGHAYGILSDTGVEVLVHVGVDTVAMEGEGFTAHVQKGEVVAVGQPLVDFDLERIRAAGHATPVITIVTNSARFSTIEPREDIDVAAGDLVVVIER